MISEFSYLNISSIGRNLIQEENDCGYACLEIPSCFSYNVAAFPDVNGKLLCELLPSDKFNNSDKFNASKEFHHFYIPVSQTSNSSKMFLLGKIKSFFLFVCLIIFFWLSLVSKVSICKWKCISSLGKYWMQWITLCFKCKGIG